MEQTGDLAGDPFSMQLILTHELTKEKNYWLQSLRSNITDPEEIRDLADHYEEYQDEVLYSDIMNAIRSIINVIKVTDYIR